MYVNSHDLGTGKGETILDTKFYIIKLLALWLNHSFNRFLLSQLWVKSALGRDLYRLIILLKTVNHVVTPNITNCVLLEAKKTVYFMQFDSSPTNRKQHKVLVWNNHLKKQTLKNCLFKTWHKLSDLAYRRRKTPIDQKNTLKILFKSYSKSYRSFTPTCKPFWTSR